MWKAVLIIALIVVVSIAALAAGGLRGPGDPGDVADRLQGWLGDAMSAHLPASDLTVTRGGCSRSGSQITLRPDRTCTLAIAEGGGRVRKGDIAASRGTIDVEFTPARGDDYSTARDGTISAPDRFALDIRKEGGTLTLTCRSEDDCLVRVARR